jgi:heat shock protein HslJ
MRMTRSSLILVVGLLVAVSGLGACSTALVDPRTPPGTDRGTPGTTGLDPAELDGRDFVSQTVLEKGKPRVLPKDVKVRLGFRQGRVNAGAGCNSMSGPFILDGSTLRVQELMTTAMACDPALMAQDEWLGSLLDAGPTLVLAGDRLTFTSGDGDTVIELLDLKAADPDRPLVGTTWRLDAIVSGPAVSSGPIGDERPTLVLEDGGTVRFTDACKQGSGRYSIENDVLFFTGVAADPSTDGTCTAANASVDTAIAALLDGSAGFTIDGPILKVMEGDHGIWWRAA